MITKMTVQVGFSPQVGTSIWHDPSFETAVCLEMSPRTLLGLPHHLVPLRLDSESKINVYERDEQSELVCQMQSPDHSMRDRFRAAMNLSLMGDTRIDAVRPSMIRISGGKVPIGLRCEEVDSVLSRYSGLGLDRTWIEKECPLHEVNLQPYSIGRYPVTNLEWRNYLLETHNTSIPEHWTSGRFPVEIGNHPVHSIPLTAVHDYLAWLNSTTGRHFRLPSEAEWEYAAAGPEHLEFPWGPVFRPDHCNTAETGLLTTTAVGMFANGDSGFGVSDMAGNVEEFVADTYSAYPGGLHIHDHLAQVNGQYQVARGGSYCRFRDLARTTRRHGPNSASSVYVVGFRLAESLDE